MTADQRCEHLYESAETCPWCVFADTVRAEDRARWNQIRHTIEATAHKRGYASGYIAGRRKGETDALKAVSTEINKMIIMLGDDS